MHTLTWQKSTYSAEAANCVYIATESTGGTVHLRESDEPDVVLTTTQAPFRSLIRTLKTAPLLP